jgi:hypothetical protein
VAALVVFPLSADVFPHSPGGLNHFGCRPGLAQAAVNTGLVHVINSPQRTMESWHFSYPGNLTAESGEKGIINSLINYLTLKSKSKQIAKENPAYIIAYWFLVIKLMF